MTEISYADIWSIWCYSLAGLFSCRKESMVVKIHTTTTEIHEKTITILNWFPRKFFLPATRHSHIHKKTNARSIKRRIAIVIKPPSKWDSPRHIHLSRNDLWHKNKSKTIFQSLLLSLLSHSWWISQAHSSLSRQKKSKTQTFKHAEQYFRLNH